MRRSKNPSINDVIHRYSRRAVKAKLTVRKLNRDTVLIEGNSVSLKFLAHSRDQTSAEVTFAAAGD